MRPTDAPDGQLDALSRSTRDSLRELDRLPFIAAGRSQVLQVTLAAGTANRVNHGLRRRVSGYLVLYAEPVSSAAAAGGPSLDVRANDANSVTFSSATAHRVTLLLW